MIHADWLMGASKIDSTNHMKIPKELANHNTKKLRMKLFRCLFGRFLPRKHVTTSPLLQTMVCVCACVHVCVREGGEGDVAIVISVRLRGGALMLRDPTVESGVGLHPKPRPCPKQRPWSPTRSPTHSNDLYTHIPLKPGPALFLLIKQC